MKFSCLLLLLCAFLAEPTQDTIKFDVSSQGYELIFDASQGGCLTNITQDDGVHNILLQPVGLECHTPASMRTLSRTSTSLTVLVETSSRNTTMHVNVQAIYNFTIDFRITTSSSSLGSSSLSSNSNNVVLKLPTPPFIEPYGYYIDGAKVQSFGSNGTCSAALIHASNWYFLVAHKH